MLTFIILISCLLYSLSSGQTSTIVNYPTLGPVYPVANNDSLLNYTFIYPTNYRFDKLFVRFTIYDFIGNTVLNPQPYPFLWANFTNSNVSLPWVVPSIILQAGDYIIGCFEWVQTDNSSNTISDIQECVLSRTKINSTLLSIANSTISTATVTNNAATIYAYYPVGLPYDQINITSTLNGTIPPSMTNSTSNATYSSINIFTFMNLTSTTYYNICICFSYANSKIDGTEVINYQCQTIMTLADTSTTIPPGISSTAIAPGTSSSTIPSGISSTAIAPGTSSSTIPPGISSTAIAPSTSSSTIPPGTSSTTSPNNSSNKILSNLTFIIISFIFAFI